MISTLAKNEADNSVSALSLMLAGAGQIYERPWHVHVE